MYFYVIFIGSVFTFSIKGTEKVEQVENRSISRLPRGLNLFHESGTCWNKWNKRLWPHLLILLCVPLGNRF